MDKLSEHLKEILDSEHFVEFALENMKLAVGARNDAELANILGVSPSNVSTWRKRGTVPYREIVRYCLLNDLALERAIFGEEPPSGRPSAAWAERFAVVGRYRTEASAGHGAAVEEEEVLEHMAFQRQWLRAIGVQPDKAVVVTARGDSMEPLINDGDLVIVDQTQQQLVDGVFVLNRDRHLVIKRVQDLLDGRWMLKSENDAYDPIVIDPKQADDLRIVGRARYTWAGRRL